jgi:hypothetical protein
MRRLAPLLAVLLGAAVAPSAALAQQQQQPSVSSNWAGYAAVNAKFSHIVGYWTAPTAACTAGSAATYSAFWVGIGGYSTNSNALEQIGTEADCTRSGTPVYSAWYELVPASPVTLKLQIAPGDQVKAAVTVNGHKVSLQMRDMTTGATYGRKLSMSQPDITSAEWIAEAPSLCDSSNSCSPLPLTDFGTVSFTGASATTAKGHTGTISDKAWVNQEIELQGDTSGRHRGYNNVYSGSGATPTALTPDGSSFAVNYQQPQQTTTPGGASGPTGPAFGGPLRHLARR